MLIRNIIGKLIVVFSALCLVSCAQTSNITKNVYNKETIAPENAIKAALVSASEGGTVVLEVEDVDVTDDDEAGRLVVSLDELQVGKKNFSYPKSSDNSVRRIVIRALPVNSSARDLINLMKD